MSFLYGDTMPDLKGHALSLCRDHADQESHVVSLWRDHAWPKDPCPFPVYYPERNNTIAYIGQSSNENE